MGAKCIFVLLLATVMLASWIPCPKLEDFHLSGIESETESDWPEATYLSLMAVTYDTWVGGSVIFVTEAVKPLGVSDTAWFGAVDLDIIEGNPNGSAGAYNVFAPDVPLTRISMDEGMGMFLIMDTEAEFIAIRTRGDGLRPSMPVGIEVVEAGDIPTAAHIDGFEVYAPEVDEGPFFYSLYAVDDSGRPVTVDDADSFVVWVESEEIDDGSALLTSLLDDISGSRVFMTPIGGRGLFRFTDDAAEAVTIGAAIYRGDDIYESPEFAIDPVPEGTGMAVLPFPATGPCGTVGVDYSFTAMAFDPISNEPDFDNSTTEVNLTLFDIAGDLSTTYEPTDWAALTAGVRGYSISNTEADSFGVFMKMESRGTPYLGELFKMPVPFYPPGRATRLAVLGQSIAFTGDTAKFRIVGIDGFGTIDTDAEGFWGVRVSDGTHAGRPTVYMDDDSFPSWAAWNRFAQTDDGHIDFGVKHDMEDEISVGAWDAEEGMYFDMGYLGEAMDFSVSFIAGSYNAPVRYAIHPAYEGFFQTGTPYVITFTCNTAEGIPKRDHTGYANLSITGSATLSEDEVYFERGIATVVVRDNEAEEVTLSISGAFDGAEVNLIFLEPGEPAGIYVPTEDLDPPMAGVGFSVPVLVWSPGGIVSTYSGPITIEMYEPDGDGTVTYPETVMISAGFGEASFYDSEVEVVTVTATASDLYDASYDIPFHGLLHAEHEYTSLPVADTFTLSVVVLDGTGEDARYDGGFYLYVAESHDNSSTSYSDYTEVVSGGGEIWITDTEAETLQVFGFVEEGDPLIQDFGHELFDSYLGLVVFTPDAVSEITPKTVSIGNVCPNPFNSSTELEITAEHGGEASFRIVDMQGRTVREFPCRLESGGNRIPIDMSGLPSGSYRASIFMEGETTYRNILLLK